MIKKLALSILMLFLSSSSFATTQASSIRTSQGDTFLLCNSETTSGAVCDNASGSDLVAFVHGYAELTFFFRQGAGASGATCQVYAIGHYNADGTATNVLGTPVLSDLSSYAMFSTPLSATQTAITFTGVDFNAVFAICTDATSMNATIEMRGSTKAPLR